MKRYTESVLQLIQKLWQQKSDGKLRTERIETTEPGLKKKNGEVQKRVQSIMKKNTLYISIRKGYKYENKQED